MDGRTAGLESQGVIRALHFVDDGFCWFELLHGGEKRAARQSFVVQNPEMKISPWRIFVAALQ